MRDKRGIAILAAVSAVLLAAAIGYFALTPGAWSSLGFGAQGAALLQTTVSKPDTGSADASAEKDEGSAAQTVATEDKEGKTTAGDGNGRGAAGESATSTSSAPTSSTSSETSAGAADSPSAPTSDPAADASASQAPAPAPTPTPAPAQTVSVSVSVSSSAVGNPVSASGTYALDKGATAYDALLKLGLSVNAPSSSMGVYVAAIGGLAEKEHGPSSGWMFLVNGTTPDRSASSYELQDGDSVEWYYVTG